ncbi:hypothetical protein FD754_021012, partial [Muntiacus muntjak]
TCWGLSLEEPSWEVLPDLCPWKLGGCRPDHQAPLTMWGEGPCDGPGTLPTGHDFLTLCLCFQHSHNDLLLLNKESVLDPVMDTFSTHGTTTGLADMFLRFRQPHENFRSLSMNASKLPWAHTICGFSCFPNLLGINVNNSITRGSGQPGFIRGCVVEQPTMVCQMLHHLNASRCCPWKRPLCTF